MVPERAIVSGCIPGRIDVVFEHGTTERDAIALLARLGLEFVPRSSEFSAGTVVYVRAEPHGSEIAERIWALGEPYLWDPDLRTEDFNRSLFDDAFRTELLGDRLPPGVRPYLVLPVRYPPGTEQADADTLWAAVRGFKSDSTGTWLYGSEHAWSDAPDPVADLRILVPDGEPNATFVDIARVRGLTAVRTVHVGGEGQVAVPEGAEERWVERLRELEPVRAADRVCPEPVLVY